MTDAPKPQPIALEELVAMVRGHRRCRLVTRVERSRAKGGESEIYDREQRAWGALELLLAKILVCREDIIPRLNRAAVSPIDDRDITT